MQNYLFDLENSARMCKMLYADEGKSHFLDVQTVCTIFVSNPLQSGLIIVR